MINVSVNKFLSLCIVSARGLVSEVQEVISEGSMPLDDTVDQFHKFLHAVDFAGAHLNLLWRLLNTLTYSIGSSQDQ